MRGRRENLDLRMNFGVAIEETGEMKNLKRKKEEDE